MINLKALDRYANLRRDYEERKMTIAKIAINYGVSYRAVWGALVRQGIPRRSQAVRDQRGSKNPAWLGDKASYWAMHRRIKKVRGAPSKCERCGATKPGRYEWANLTGNYADPFDYIRLCKSCHNKQDGLAGNLFGTPPTRKVPKQRRDK